MLRSETRFNYKVFLLSNHRCWKRLVCGLTTTGCARRWPSSGTFLNASCTTNTSSEVALTRKLLKSKNVAVSLVTVKCENVRVGHIFAMFAHWRLREFKSTAKMQPSHKNANRSKHCTETKTESFTIK